MDMKVGQKYRKQYSRHGDLRSNNMKVIWQWHDSRHKRNEQMSEIGLSSHLYIYADIGDQKQRQSHNGIRTAFIHLDDLGKDGVNVCICVYEPRK